MSLTTKSKQTGLCKTLLTSDQNLSVDRLYSFDETMLIAGMGSGKTIISLTAITELIEDGVLDRVLVFAPLKVVDTVWRQEAAKWSHTCDLNVKFCAGTPKQRVAIIEDMQQSKGILLLNFDIMAWFFTEYKKAHGFDGLLIDELSKLKGGGKGFKKLRFAVKSFKWRVGMTGTPVAENFEGLFYQTFTLDGGERFGGARDKFMNEYFYPTDFNEYNWELKKGGAEKIHAKLKGLVYTVPDYRHELPKLVQEKIFFDMPESARAMYKELSNHHVITLDGHDQVADNAAVLSGKLQQIASGAIYVDDEFGERVGVHAVHDVKVQGLSGFLSSKTEPVIICYWYKHELERLRELLPDAVELSEKGAMESWNNGELDILLMQPMSASHGIQLQFGGSSMVFFSPIWSNDIVEQTIARIWRKGQTEQCDIYEFVMRGTVEELIIDRVEGKKQFDALFHSFLS